MEPVITSITEGLMACKRMLAESLGSDVDLINQVTQHLLLMRGKLVRPRLVLLSAQACGGWDERAVTVATAVELLHTGALIHDDVIDGSQLRRGMPSLNSRWNNHISVLMGDYLFSKSFSLMVKLNSWRLVGIFSKATERMSRGEMLQVEMSHRLEVQEKDYLRVIADKTASLFSASCEMGAVLATGRVNFQECLARFGENLGCAYQIMDDLLDLVGVEDLTGKPVGSDIRGKKATLPLIYSLSQAPVEESRKVREKIQKGVKGEDWWEVVHFTQNYGGVDYARLKAEEFARAAEKELEALEGSEAKQGLLEIVKYTMARNR